MAEKWNTGEKCRRKGGTSMVTYFVAETSESGARLQVVKGGKRIGIGRWHSWKIMEMDFTPSAPRLGKLAWFGNHT